MTCSPDSPDPLRKATVTRFPDWQAKAFKTGRFDAVVKVGGSAVYGDLLATVAEALAQAGSRSRLLVFSGGGQDRPGSRRQGPGTGCGAVGPTLVLEHGLHCRICVPDQGVDALASAVAGAAGGAGCVDLDNS